MHSHFLGRLFLSGLIAAFVLSAGATSAGAGAANFHPQQFVLYTSNLHGTDLPAVVRAAGLVDGVGTETQTDKDTNGGQTNYATLHLAGGTLRFVAPERFAWKPNLATCSATADGGGTWKITGGTGRFKSAAGSGTFTSRGILLGARDAKGRCLGERAQPTVNYVIVTLTGSMRL